MSPETLFHIKKLRVSFALDQRRLVALDGLDLAVRPGEVLGIVGESGAGKTVGLMTALGLNRSAGMRQWGSVEFLGKDLLELGEGELRRLRGRHVGLVFQNPVSSLNPFLRVGEQIWESPLAHGLIPRSERKNFAVEMMRKVGIADADKRWKDYPHQFSGGMCQRVMIASAISCGPELVVADEPTSSLDATVERQVLDLMMQLRADHGTALVLVTHNLAQALLYCDRIALLYGGQLLEIGTALHILENPRHPYTRFLLDLAHRRVGGRNHHIRDFKTPSNTVLVDEIDDFPHAQAPLVSVAGEDGHIYRDLWLDEGYWEKELRSQD